MTLNPGSNYPPGSMRGSGIDSTEYEAELMCGTCGTEQRATVHVDDWGRTEWVCEVCETRNEDLYGRDPDEDYEAMRDARMEEDHDFPDA